MKAIKLTHPKYGLTHLLQIALRNERPQTEDRNIGMVVNLTTFRECMKLAYEAGATIQPKSFDQFISETCERTPPGMRELNTYHLEEAIAAKADLPRMGVVNSIVAFEEFVYEFFDRVFDQIYSDVDIVKGFEKLWSYKSKIRDNTTETCQNVIQLWLKDSNNITEGMKNNFKFCRRTHDTTGRVGDESADTRVGHESEATTSMIRVEFKATTSMIREESDATTSRVGEKSEDTTSKAGDESEYIVEEMYEHMKNNPQIFVQTIGLILADYKKKCLDTIATLPTLDSIAKVVGHIFKHSFESTGSGSKIFREVFTEICYKNDEYFGMIMHVWMDPSNPKKYFNFNLRNENILKTIALVENDNNNMCVQFEINQRLYIYPLRGQDKREVRNFYRDHHCWTVWIDDEARYNIKEGNQKTLEQLMHLFFGITSLLLRGRSEKLASRTCTLADKPSSLNLIAVKDTTYPAGEEKSHCNRLFQLNDPEDIAKTCESHLLNIWQEALDKGDKLTVNYYLYYTIVRFFRYVAQGIGQTTACCLWNLSPLYGGDANFAIDQRDLENIFTKFVK